MAPYSNSAFGPPFKNIARISTQIQPQYLFGSRDYKTEPMVFSISNVSLTSNVATATVQLQSGGGMLQSVVPVVGAKMGVKGTQTSGGVYNVDPTKVTASTVSALTGAGTISWALTNANIGSAADVGTLIVQSAEVPDFVAAGSTSAPLGLIFTPDEDDNSRCLFAEAVWSGTIPTAAVVILQAANVDDDARYYAMQNVFGVTPNAVVASSVNLATIAGSAVTQAGANYQYILGKFIRAKVLSMTGGDGTTGLVVTVFA